MPTASGDTEQGGALPRTALVTLHLRQLDDVVLLRLAALKLGCQMQCRRPPGFRFVIVKRVRGWCLVGSFCGIVCEGHARKLKAMLESGGNLQPFGGVGMGGGGL